MYISNFLNDPLLGSKAEEAFCRGCEENGAFIALNANELIEIVRLYPGKQDIVRGICFILCSNPHLMKQHLPSMLKIQFDLL